MVILVKLNLFLRQCISTLNSIAAKKASVFDNMLAQNFNDLEGVQPKKLKYTDCIKAPDSIKKNKNHQITHSVA